MPQQCQASKVIVWETRYLCSVLARVQYLVAGIGFLLMVVALAATMAMFNFELNLEGAEYRMLTRGTFLLVSGTFLGVMFFVIGWSLIMVAIGLSFGLARRK